MTRRKILNNAPAVAASGDRIKVGRRSRRLTAVQIEEGRESIVSLLTEAFREREQTSGLDTSG